MWKLWRLQIKNKKQKNKKKNENLFKHIYMNIINK